MHFTRYSIDFLHLAHPGRQTSETIRERKYWAADQFLAKNPEQKLLVADMNGRMIGYVLGTIAPLGEEGVRGYLNEVFVDEFYRREGIGSDLCRKILEWIRDQEATSIQVSLHSSHHRGSEFLEKVGFSPVRTLFEYKFED
ncbi:ribosomal-protein-alanine N-acetyltransferase [Halobacillus karajensis]|uniref:Acetyltransferase n=1 Tax=Halobacillus karajensis TaxID=195088 RepID=A0A024P8L3_9BACI|nr:GNAT family N-acetyltransferase [Halobacillus karajensis]CDQ21545.1 putative acetyltransferase [Halobacillus karajensis]CDQ25479.1 putative acetyltransferase [Halobacillus karajensis]CDQ28990.1 putative acetyltransferase [Halobacillus karajensis]SEI09122.1 ribosomal-protein-alanine N-acetyltransferase [Halobacillus karajensis]